MNERRCALIVGITGQDGSLLAKHLLARGYDVQGGSRRQDLAGNLQTLAIAGRVRVHQVDPLDRAQVMDAIAAVRPDEVYNLSGQASVGRSFAEPRETWDSHVGSTEAILDAIRIKVPACRFFHASSGEIFGETGQGGASETTPMAPCSPYAEAKAAATELVRRYRESLGLFACSGILFNHESVLRSEAFVTQRIVRSAAEISIRGGGTLTLGRLDIARDWGWAPDYVECMAAMLEQDEPRDYVVATGVATTLQQFVERAFSHFQLDWTKHVEFDPARVRASDVNFSIGDPRLAEQRLGWRARVRMPELADRLAGAALASVQR